MSVENDQLKILMGQIHSQLAQNLLDRLLSGEATASELNVARQFLKDNLIESRVEVDGTLGKLLDQLDADSEERPRELYG